MCTHFIWDAQLKICDVQKRCTVFSSLYFIVTHLIVLWLRFFRKCVGFRTCFPSSTTCLGAYRKNVSFAFTVLDKQTHETPTSHNPDSLRPIDKFTAEFQRNYIPTSAVQRFILSAGSSITSLIDPHRSIKRKTSIMILNNTPYSPSVNTAQTWHDSMLGRNDWRSSASANTVRNESNWRRSSYTWPETKD